MTKPPDHGHMYKSSASVCQENGHRQPVETKQPETIRHHRPDREKFFIQNGHLEIRHQILLSPGPEAHHGPPTKKSKSATALNPPAVDCIG